ncbi:hypothetical protein H0H92_014404, partial [Tricholoma furcatifolium]
QTHKKRRKLASGLAVSSNEDTLSLSREFFNELGNGDPSVLSFQDIIDRDLPDFLQTRLSLQESTTEFDLNGKRLRPPTRSEVSSLISKLPNSGGPTSVSAAIVERKLKVNRVKEDRPESQALT